MNKSYVWTFVTGLSIGAGIALLFAPYSGRRTRIRIAGAAADGAAYAKECGETVRDTTRDVIGRGKEVVAEVVKRAGQSYKHAVG